MAYFPNTAYNADEEDKNDRYFITGKPPLRYNGKDAGLDMVYEKLQKSHGNSRAVIPEKHVHAHLETANNYLAEDYKTKKNYERPFSAASNVTATGLDLDFAENGDDASDPYTMIDDSKETVGIKTRFNKKLVYLSIILCFLVLTVIVVGVTVYLKKTPGKPITLGDISSNSIVLTFNDIFDIASASYSVIVSTSVAASNPHSRLTWASVHDQDPQPSYVTINKCHDFFILGDKCQVNSGNRIRRGRNKEVTIVIGNQQCDRTKVDEYCNGPLKEDTEYFITLTAQNEKDFDHSKLFGPIKTAKTSTTPATSSTSTKAIPSTTSDKPTWTTTIAKSTVTNTVEYPTLTTSTKAIPSTTSDKLTSTTTIAKSTVTSTDEYPTSTTSEPAIEIEKSDDYSIDKAGTWGSWGSYTACTVTCGIGTQTRTRSCLTTKSPCTGPGNQIQDCGMQRCIPAEIHGTWSVWSSWDICSKSCGTGMQKRKRTCNMQNGANKECVGPTEQSRYCNEQICPSCNMPCPGGSISVDCTYCKCTDSYTIQVHSMEGLVLVNATISPAMAPQNILAISSVSGYISISNQCSTSIFVLQKSGYISVAVNGSDLSSSHKVFMQKIQPLSVIKHPQDRMRLPGESVTLCCEFSGIPLPENIEWFKDDILIETSPGGGSSYLVLNQVSVSDNGYYSCRANNDYSAIKSSEAFLNIKENRNEFCSSLPHSKVIILPDGCQVNGDSTFDKGECPPSACRGSTEDNGTCTELDTYCCGPLSYARVDVPCEDNITLNLLMVKTCGCVFCTPPKLYVSGTAGHADGTKLYHGEIWSNGSLLQQTDEDGSFFFEIPFGTERLTLLFQDKILKELVDIIYVAEFPRGAEGSQYISVKMLKKDMSYTINAVDVTEVLLASSTTGKNIANLTVGPNSFYMENGTQYTGTIIGSFSVIDTSDIDSISSSPGDFTITDESGNTQQLDTFGMFSLDFETENGEKLNVPGDITISVSEDQLGNVTNSDGVSDIKLWSMNTITGQWIFESDIIKKNNLSRKKRQLNGAPGQSTYRTTIRGLSVSTRWYNFDYIRRMSCYSKVRVFKYENLAEPLEKARVSVVVESGTGGQKSLSMYRARTDYRIRNDRNGYCIIHPCRNPRQSINFVFKAWIFAEDKSRNQLFPIDPNKPNSGLSKNIVNSLQCSLDESHSNTIFVGNVDLGLASQGPFYDWEAYKNWPYSTSCSQANINHNHFTFVSNQCEISTDTFEYTTDPKNKCEEKYYLLWYELKSHLRFFNSNFYATFIKVHTPGLNENIKIKAVTEIVETIKMESGLGNAGKSFGTRQTCPQEQSNISCLEVKVPTSIACSRHPNHVKTLKSTRIRVIAKAANKKFKVSEINTHLKQYDVSNIGDDEFTMLLEHIEYGNLFGIYHGKGDTEERARENALRKCLNGDENKYPFAVKFK